MTETATQTQMARRPLLSGRSRVVALIGLVTAASLAVWAHNFAAFGTTGTFAQVSLPWPVLALAFYLSESYVVHLQFRRQAHTLSASEIALTLGLFFVSPAGLLAAQLVGAGVAIVVNRRQKPIKVWFNLAELSLSSGLGLLVFRSIVTVGEHGVSTWFAALLAAVVAHAVGVLLVTAVIAVAEGLFSASQLGRVLIVSTVGTLSACCLGLLVVELLARDPVALLLLALPVIACGVSFRAYMNQREQRERVEFLYESMRATQGAPEFGLAVGELLVAARRLLRADYAEILLLSPVAGEEALQSVSGQDGERLMQRVTVAAVDERAIGTIAASPKPILLARRRSGHQLDGFLGARGLHDAIVCGLTGEQRTFGVLLVGNRVGDVSTFAREDVALLETFASHASVLLENGRLERSLAQVTELKEELHHQAYTDALTQLPNRLLFTQRLDETLAEEPTARGSHAVLFLDLNRFKVVNDSWGHAAGDELLVQVADRIRAAVRPQDTAARLGGDEFAVLVRETDAAGALRAARRLIDVINAPIALSSGQQAAVHASVGVAVTGPDASTPEELLRNADLAMYTAKTEERPYALFEPALHHRIRARRSLALELERAAERGEFVSYFQPVVSLVDGTIQAFEALARWEHPERGLLRAGRVPQRRGGNGSDLRGRRERAGTGAPGGRRVARRASRRRAPGDLGQRRARGAHRRTARARARGGDDAGEDRRAADDGRDHRVVGRARRAGRVACDAPASGARGPAVDRRFRYRVLLAVAARGVPDRAAQDPEAVRGPADRGQAGSDVRRRDLALGRFAWARVDQRGSRGRPPGEAVARPRLRSRAGFPVRQAHAGRRRIAATAVSPGRRPARAPVGSVVRPGVRTVRSRLIIRSGDYQPIS